MFIVTLEDGTRLVEGRDVKTWGDVPTDKRIIAVTITDCKQLYETLTGYDYYICCYEAVSAISATAGEGDEMIFASKGTRDVAQQLWGVRSYDLMKRSIQKIAGQTKAELEEVFNASVLKQNALFIEARANKHKEINRKVEELTEKLNAKEVCLVKLGISIEYMSKDECKQNKDFSRQGIQDEVDVSKEAEIRKYFKNEYEPIKKK